MQNISETAEESSASSEEILNSVNEITLAIVVFQNLHNFSFRESIHKYHNTA